MVIRMINRLNIWMQDDDDDGGGLGWVGSGSGSGRGLGPGHILMIILLGFPLIFNFSSIYFHIFLQLFGN